MNNLSLLNKKILSYLQKKLLYQAVSGIVNISILLVIVWLSTFIADHIFYFSVPVRWFVLIVNVILTIYLIYHFLAREVLDSWKMKKSGDYTQLTKEIGTGIPNLSDRITNIYQLSRDVEGGSDSLKQLAIDRFIKIIKDVDFTSILNIKNHLISYPVIVMVIAGSIILLLMTSDALSVSARRILNPAGNYEIIPEYSFTVSPGDTSILNGSPLDLSVKYQGPRAEKILMEYRSSGSEILKHTELTNVFGIFTGQIANIRKPLEYQLRAVPEGRPVWQDKMISPVYTVDVKTPPAITELQVRVTPPAYTQLPVQIFDKNLGNVIAYAGSRIKITARSTKELNAAALIFSDGQKTDLRIQESKLSGDFPLKNSGTYYFEISDKENLKNIDPIVYQITVLEDRHPLVELIDPGDDIEIPPDAAVNLLIDANDDFGFTKLGIKYQMISSIEALGDSSWKAINVPILEKSVKYFQQGYLWNFQMLNVGYGDALKYYITVWDNDRISGPKQSRTRTYQIRFPTLDQIFSEFDNRQNENIDKTNEIVQDSEELKKEIEKIQRELKREKNIDWDRKKELESVIEKQKQVEKKLSEIEKSLEDALKKMEKSQLLSPDVLKKYQQLQELFKDLMTPELTKALEELRKSLENLDKKEVDKSLADFQINQEEFQKNVERTLELFKKVKIEQELDRLAQLSKQMLERQKEMSTALNDKNLDNKNLSKDLQRQTDQQKSSLEQIQNSLKNLEMEPMIWEYPETEQLLQESAEEINSKNIQGQLNKLQSQMNQNNQQMAAQSSGQLEQDLESLSNKLDQAKKILTSQAQNKISSLMQRATDNLLSLSKAEEDIIRGTKSASGISDQMRDMAAQQQAIADNTSRVIQDIVELSNQTFALPSELSMALGKANYNMRKSIAELEERNQRGAGDAQVEAMAGLNEAVMGMQQAMNDMKSSGSPFGMEKFMEQLKQLAQRQGQVNQQSMQLMPGDNGPPGGISPGEQQRLRRLSAEQRAIQESLDQMHDENGDEQALGSLNKISEDMEEVLKDLEALKIDRRTIDRQQKILTRMLDAQKSVREREYSKERKSEIGKEYARKSPDDEMDTVDKRSKKLQLDLMRALQEGYNPDYEKLIEAYFKTLNQEYLKD